MFYFSFDYGVPSATDPIERVFSRPDATFRMYGSFRCKANSGYVNNKPSICFNYQDHKSKVANDLTIRLWLEALPRCMAQTDDDPHIVLEMALAYAERGIRLEYHMFHGGPHVDGLYHAGDADKYHML